MEQTDEELAEMVARFRTPPGFNWEPLRDDIFTLLRSLRARLDAQHGAGVMALVSRSH